MIHSQAYHITMDDIYTWYKEEIVNPWVRSFLEEGEKSLIGTIKLCSKVAEGLVTSAVERYIQEMENPIAVYGNLVAAEKALRELCIRTIGLQASSRQ